MPFGAFWTLPLYELAILTAARLQTRGTRAQVVITSPEGAPLRGLRHGRVGGGGRSSSTRTASSSSRHARAVAADAGELELDDGRRIRPRAVVTLPDLLGRRVPGLPQDGEGFIAVDEHGRVPGAEGVYAAGDVTTFPLKQGGLATQQADAAAEAMLAALGVPIVPRPFEPVLKGVLFTDHEPAYLRATRAADADREPRPYSMWWPPSKIAGRHLAPYLAIRARSAARARGAARARRASRSTHRRAARGACRLQRARSERGAARVDPSDVRIAVRGSYGWRRAVHAPSLDDMPTDRHRRRRDRRPRSAHRPPRSPRIRCPRSSCSRPTPTSSSASARSPSRSAAARRGASISSASRPTTART